MMPWPVCALFCLLLAEVGTSTSSRERQCSMWPVGALHPVHAQLERFELGTGCATREGGAAETHVISVGKATDKQVNVVLKPLTPSRPINRTVILVMSSQHAVRWVVENEGLPLNISVMVQVSLNSSAESVSMSIRVTHVSSLPHRPHVLLRWTLQRHTSISSLTHAAHANRVYLRLGEDPSMPVECHLQPLFLSQNYLVSEVKEQEVHGCVPSTEPADSEVHVIRLWSAGSDLCGSRRVEVSVSLLPPVVHSGWFSIVLILSSVIPVNWALVATEVKGHITVYSSNSVSPPYPRNPALTMTSTMTPDLPSISDLLVWTNQKGFPKVTSYTEADLANRFIIKLQELKGWAGSGAGPEIRRSDVLEKTEDGETAVRQAVHSHCEGGALTVTVDTQILQNPTASTVTLRDHACRAEFNGTHFLLVFPLISCGTEAEMDGVKKTVNYTNTVFLWKRNLSEGSTNESATEAVHISCVLSLFGSGNPNMFPSSGPEGALWVGPTPAPRWTPRAQDGPLLSLELFVSDAYEKRSVGPCVISAYDRIYVQVSVSGETGLAVELQSCSVCPLSDPRAQAGWSIITDSCPSDPSFILSPLRTDTEGQTQDSTDEEERDGGVDEMRNDGREAERQPHPHWRQTRDHSREEKVRPFKDKSHDTGMKRFRGMKAEETWKRKRGESENDSAHTLRFSFILRPVFNNSIQFLHCRLRLCESGAPTDQNICAQGPRIPALTHTTSSQQCEFRNLSRPVLITSPVELLAPPAGKLAQKPAEMSSQCPTGNDSGPVLVVVFAAFLMGFSLMGALWCIYTHTGRHVISQTDGILETTELNLGPRNPVTPLEQISSSVWRGVHTEVN